MVMAGVVLVNDQRVDKPSEQFPFSAEIRIKHGEDPTARFVGRGGLKLEAALLKFQMDVTGWTCIDVGASTGGFTDCLLQHGAAKVYAIDVGHNQIDWRLRNDDRVVVREGVNARYLRPDEFEVRFDLAVIDVSFISVTKVLPAIFPLLRANAQIIVLIKPQFEVGKGNVGKGGVVRDPVLHTEVVARLRLQAEAWNAEVKGVIDSPLLGSKGNKEFLFCLQKR